MTPLERAMVWNLLKPVVRWVGIAAMFFGALFLMVAFPVLCGMI